MRTINIIGQNIFDFDKNNFNIGGVQAYIKDLSYLLADNENNVIISQWNSSDLSVDFNKIVIKGIRITKKINRKTNQRLFERIKKESKRDDLIIIATDQMNVKSDSNSVIVIQHGIAFDFPKGYFKSILFQNNKLLVFNKFLRCFRNTRRFKYIKNTVCVDYNFFNWLRTLDFIPDDAKFSVIPNYTAKVIAKEKLSNKLESRSNRKIIFARRFVDYRGTLVFAEVAKKILHEYNDIEIGFAGDGPLKEFLVNCFKSEKRVQIFSYKHDESLDIHFKYDIAVVPTIFSEGTSLSLCEAFGAGCFPIATHVGGMTNMIIDGYNGLLAYPKEIDVYKAVKNCLDMDEGRFNFIVQNAWETANSAFIKKIWDKRWLEYVKTIKEINL